MNIQMLFISSCRKRILYQAIGKVEWESSIFVECYIGLWGRRSGNVIMYAGQILWDGENTGGWEFDGEGREEEEM